MPNFEKYAWLFMRFSGVAPLFPAIGHPFIGLFWEDGAYRIDFNYTPSAGRRRSGRLYVAMLWLAQLHGGNGMRTIIADHFTRTRPDSGSTACWRCRCCWCSWSAPHPVDLQPEHFQRSPNDLQVLPSTTW